MSGMGAPRIDMEPQIPGSPFAGRVLLVDDMHDDVELLAILLAPLEASVVVAGLAKEALAILDQQIVDLVVTDLNMPGKSGLDLAREVGARSDVPAVIFIPEANSWQTGSRHRARRGCLSEKASRRCPTHRTRPRDSSFTLRGPDERRARRREATRTEPSRLHKGRHAGGDHRRAHGRVHISTGDMLRAHVSQGTELGRKAQAYMDKGLLTPDELVIGMFMERLARDRRSRLRARWIPAHAAAGAGARCRACTRWSSDRPRDQHHGAGRRADGADDWPGAGSRAQR